MTATTRAATVWVWVATLVTAVVAAGCAPAPMTSNVTNAGGWGLPSGGLPGSDAGAKDSGGAKADAGSSDSAAQAGDSGSGDGAAAGGDGEANADTQAVDGGQGAEDASDGGATPGDDAEPSDDAEPIDDAEPSDDAEPLEDSEEPPPPDAADTKEIGEDPNNPWYATPLPDQYIGSDTADAGSTSDTSGQSLPPICTPLIGSVSVTETVGPGGKIDIVVWIDTSGSMSQEAAWTNQNMNKFTQYLENKKIDYRLVLYGTGLGLCIGPPLGDAACNSAQPQKFLTIKQGVASTNGLTMMQTQTNFDKFKQFLRADAVHNMIGITDDQSATPAATFKTNYSNLLSKQGLNPNFVYHAICSFVNAANPNQAGNCPTGASYGSQHIALAQSTGGTLYQVCLNDWTAIFDGLSKAVAATAKPVCTYKLPVPAGKLVTWKNVKISHVENQKVAQLKMITGETGCAASPDGWYYDDPTKPTTATLCPETCKKLVGGAVMFNFGCPQTQLPGATP